MTAPQRSIATEITTILSFPRATRMLQRLRAGLRLLRAGQGGRVWHALRVRLRSSTRAYGLRRDLRVVVTPPPAKLVVALRPLDRGDDLAFLEHAPGLDPSALRTRLDQRRLVADDLPTCWVAIDPTGQVAYMQWLITAEHDARREARWGQLFPELAADEVLLEGAYTPETHRGLGVMPHAMARIAETAAALGARTAITFVGVSNIPSLKGCEKAGFTPYVERVESWSFFRRRIRFTPLASVPAEWSGAPRS